MLLSSRKKIISTGSRMCETEIYRDKTTFNIGVAGYDPAGELFNGTEDSDWEVLMHSLM